MVLLVAVSSGWRVGGSEKVADPPQPVVVHTCLVTGKFTQLLDFYQHVLGIAPRVSGGVYAEFPTKAGVLAIFTAEAQERYMPGSAQNLSLRLPSLRSFGLSTLTLAR